MEAEDQTPANTAGPEPSIEIGQVLEVPGSPVAPDPPETRFMMWSLFGSDGLRAGWSVLLFLFLLCLFLIVSAWLLAAVKVPGLHGGVSTAAGQILNELTSVLSLVAAGIIVAKIERRRLSAYYLAGERRIAYFGWGLLGGFVALSALVGGLYAGGWIRFGPNALHGAGIAEYAALWGIGFLLVGLFEEGAFRCYLLFTFTRGLGSGWRGFFFASLVTSALFGAIHMSNGGESRIGIFSVMAIGFVFCMSVRLTGSVWWAIGFHAAWDWAETFFYGTADSGIVLASHWLTTSPTGDTFWSGGSTGPEGSILIFPLVVLVLAGLYMAYGGKQRSETPSPAGQPQLS